MPRRKLTLTFVGPRVELDMSRETEWRKPKYLFYLPPWLLQASWPRWFLPMDMNGIIKVGFVRR